MLIKKPYLNELKCLLKEFRLNKRVLEKSSSLKEQFEKELDGMQEQIEDTKDFTEERKNDKVLKKR